MAGFMDLLKIFSGNQTSKDAAKDRLKLVLVHDRANVSPTLLENMKEDLLKCLSKYLEIDTEQLDIQMTRVKSDDGDVIVPALVANIPILKVREKN